MHTGFSSSRARGPGSVPPGRRAKCPSEFYILTPLEVGDPGEEGQRQDTRGLGGSCSTSQCRANTGKGVEGLVGMGAPSSECPPSLPVVLYTFWSGSDCHELSGTAASGSHMVTTKW